MTRLMEFIINNEYKIVDDDITFINDKLHTQRVNEVININNGFINDDNVSEINIIIKNWDDYESSDYSFHSPPDCMYYKYDDGYINADIIDEYGSINVKAYKHKDDITYKVFNLIENDPSYILELKEWMFKFKE